MVLKSTSGRYRSDLTLAKTSRISFGSGKHLLLLKAGWVGTTA